MIENPEKQWLKQVLFLTDTFASDAGISRWQYEDILPSYAPQPEEYKDRLDYLVLVQPPLRGKYYVNHMMELLGAHGFAGGDIERIGDWREDPGNFKIPSKPYATWVDPQRQFIEDKFKINEGRLMDGVTDYQKVRKGIKPDERCGTIFDGIFLSAHHPSIFDEWAYHLNCPGTEHGTGVFVLSTGGRIKNEVTGEYDIRIPYNRHDYASGLRWSCGWGGTPIMPTTRWLVASRIIVTK